MIVSFHFLERIPHNSQKKKEKPGKRKRFTLLNFGLEGIPLSLHYVAAAAVYQIDTLPRDSVLRE